MIPYDKTEHGSWYWLWVDGPDGREWMLARRQTRWPDGFAIPFEGPNEVVIDDVEGLTLRGKWTILEIHPCAPPQRAG